MTVKLVAFGIAKDILKTTSMEMSVTNGTTIGELKQTLVERFPEFDKLRTLKFAINEDYQSDEHGLKDMDEVVIIPPVSGG